MKFCENKVKKQHCETANEVEPSDDAAKGKMKNIN